MIPMRLAVFAILLFSLVLAAACLQKLHYGSSGFVDQYADSLNRTPIASPADLEECQLGECWCVACKNNTPLFPGRQNMIGGSCYVEKECKSERLNQLNDKTQTPDMFPLQFMVGQGPTFGDFGTANTYCANKLSMSVQWLVGNNESPYLLPNAKRAMCFLSKGVMPVFVLYSNGTEINSSRTYEIGRILSTQGKDYYNGLLTNGPVGPVVVVTEMNFDASRAGDVAKEVIAINEGCQNDRANNKIYCFVAVAPKMNDVAALDAVMNALGGATDLVDLVAYGIDGRYMSSCSASKVLYEASNFSRYSLYNHSKPTLIPYVMFDPNVTSAGGCQWTEREVVSAYGAFFPFGIQQLQKRGVMGIAPYTFNSTAAPGLTNPLNCTDCSVGSTAARLKAWYGGCEKYAMYNRLGTPEVSDTTQILFGNTSGAVCNANTQFSYVGGFSFAGGDILRPELSTNVTKANLSYACDMCLIDNISKDPTEYFPSLTTSRVEFREDYCENGYDPLINQWAGARNLDPMFIRAVIITETGFNPCEAAKVCGPGVDLEGCFTPGPAVDECYYRAYDEMYIPDGTPGCTQLPNDIVTTGNPQWRWCGLGIMQSLEPPISFWPASYRQDGENGPYYDVFSRAGLKKDADMDAARACNPTDFNPFKASDSICIGTAKMEKMLLAAKQWIKNNKDKLNWNTETEEEKTNLFAAYIAANKYSGIWDMEGIYRVTTPEWNHHPRCDTDTLNGDCWAIGFKDSWSKIEYCKSEAGEGDTTYCNEDGTPNRTAPYPCAGYTDFMEFVLKCEVPFLPTKVTAYGNTEADRKADRGRTKMEYYLKYVTDCKSSTCPDGKKYFGLAEKNPPASGVPYLPDKPPGSQNP